MTGKEYLEQAMLFNDGNSTKRVEGVINFVDRITGEGIDVGEAFHAALGMAGETGETLDMLKKWVFHEKELDLVHLKKELGDVMWYIMLMCNAFGFDPDEIMQTNIDKLSARYPKGFNPYDANHRRKDDI